MQSNFLIAIYNLVNNPIYDIQSFYKSRNRVNSEGEALEYYIKDLFCNSFNKSLEEKSKIYSKNFSYLGNQNNPPDIMIQKGDAVEVKKVENSLSAISLNSSYPKDKLYVDSPMITEACKNCENWREKDLLYSVGTVIDGKLKLLFFVYGDCLAADKLTYERIREKIANGINELPDVEMSPTKELGRVNKIDPLGITYLRIRGMWGIESPVKVFSYLPDLYENGEFNSVSILTKEKYMSFPEKDRKMVENIDGEKGFRIIDRKIKSPNNPAQLIDSKVFIINN